jgi:hypothetical protein
MLQTEPDLTPDLTMVKVGGIDSNEWFRPGIELFAIRRRPRVDTVPVAQQLGGNPPVDRRRATQPARLRTTSEEKRRSTGYGI